MSGHALTLSERGQGERFRWAAACECGRWSCIAEQRHHAVTSHRAHVRDLGKPRVRSLASEAEAKAS